MNEQRARTDAMYALSQVREMDVQAERAIKGYIDLIEAQIHKERNQHAQTKQDLRDVGEWLNEARKTIDALRKPKV